MGKLVIIKAIIIKKRFHNTICEKQVKKGVLPRDIGGREEEIIIIILIVIILIIITIIIKTIK